MQWNTGKLKKTLYDDPIKKSRKGAKKRKEQIYLLKQFLDFNQFALTIVRVLILKQFFYYLQTCNFMNLSKTDVQQQKMARILFD